MKFPKDEKKQATIVIRIGKIQKREWKRLCRKKNISLTDLIIGSVEGRLLDDDRRKVLAFIESQDNIFAKIENNINQVAKFVNIEKEISPDNFSYFNEKLRDVANLKKEQNSIFKEIYKLLGK